MPPRLFRVRYDRSMSLTARTTPDFSTESEFERDVEQHLDWSNPNPTPFVSTFSVRRHAENWAYKRAERGCSDVVILELDPKELGPIFSVQYLVQSQFVHTNLPDDTYEDEYLVLDEICKRSIIDKKIVQVDESNSDSDESDFDSDESDFDSDESNPNSDESDSDSSFSA
ncbi:hypothetical protein PHPALM_28881 [Phytophthora palmivora]|uniref:DUF7587 domain-containing protein n=1 Tax=Phytophthora palmivora TaxID=4796 RepID=A0A2P4X8Y0_9STRA|nr:hypothetical protein PHPALM_28881 [Phytophthora palmivora]